MNSEPGRALLNTLRNGLRAARNNVADDISSNSGSRWRPTAPRRTRVTRALGKARRELATGLLRATLRDASLALLITWLVPHARRIAAIQRVVADVHVEVQIIFVPYGISLQELRQLRIARLRLVVIKPELRSAIWAV